MNTLYAEFEVERLKRYLKDQPQDSYRLAIAHFSDYLELASEYKKLEKQLQKPKLPNLHNQAQLQAEYEELLEYFVELQKANATLREDNKALRDLVEILAEDTARKKSKLPFFSQFLGLIRKLVSRKPKVNPNYQTTRVSQATTETIHALIPLLFMVFLIL